MQEFETGEYCTNGGRPRPHFKQSLKMFSPSQTGMPPKQPSKQKHRGDVYNTGVYHRESTTSNYPRSKSSFGTGGNYKNSRIEYSREASQQSALGQYAFE